MLQTPNDIGGEISVRSAIAPGTSAAVANSGVDVNGIAVDLQGESTYPAASGVTGGPANCGLAQSLVLQARASAGANAPALTSFKVRLQDSADGSTGWADFVPDVIAGTGSNPAGTKAGSTSGVAAFDTDINVRVDVRKARRYVRAVFTPVFTGANSTVFMSGAIALGGFPATPVYTPTNP